ncbi:MAG: peptidylprolyl isomerase [Candidatus Delongbacteria bacterium]|jgi:hypothetical protein|nr:peptidylprolyl isomerase [Candidatus Delongbacteria bacterium]
MDRFIKIWMILTIIVNSYALIDSTQVLTPGYENSILAKIDGKDVREFDVFGVPSISKVRNKITNLKRSDKIQNYILDVIFQTEGNIPSIINSQGYKRTYKLLSKKVAVDTYREDITREELKNKKDEPHKDKVSNHYIAKILDSLKIAHNVKYKEELFRSISEIEISDPNEFADSLLVIGGEKELVVYKDLSTRISDLVVVIRKLKPYHIDKLRKVSVLKSLVDGKILNQLLVEIVDSKGYFEDKRVVERTIDQMKYFVSSEYKKKLFSYDNLKPSKDELIDYYIDHKDDLELKTIKKMWTYEIFKAYDNSDDIESNDKIKVALELENIRQKIIAGESFEKYAKFYARPNVRDGELGYIYRTDYAMIGQTAYSLEINEMSELIIQKKAISIIKVTEIKEPQLYKFEYVEEIVKNRVIDKKRDKLKNELRRKLFKKYNVELLYAQ